MASAPAKTVVVLGASYSGPRTRCANNRRRAHLSIGIHISIASPMRMAEGSRWTYNLRKQTCTYSPDSRSSRDTNIKPSYPTTTYIILGPRHRTTQGTLDAYESKPPPSPSPQWDHPLARGPRAGGGWDDVLGFDYAVHPTRTIGLRRNKLFIEEAASVLVVGGGELGIRVCFLPSPIRIRHRSRAPTKCVTLLHSCARLLPQLDGGDGEGGEESGGIHGEILQALHALNVHVVLRERVDLTSLGPSSESDTTTVRTTTEREIGADLALLCTGQTPNTSLRHWIFRGPWWSLLFTSDDSTLQIVGSSLTMCPIQLILSLVWYVVVKKLKKWLLPVLGKQLCKLRLLHLLCGLFDARDWNSPGNMVAALLLVLLQGSATAIFVLGAVSVFPIVTFWYITVEEAGSISKEQHIPVRLWHPDPINPAAEPSISRLKPRRDIYIRFWTKASVGHTKLKMVFGASVGSTEGARDVVRRWLRLEEMQAVEIHEWSEYTPVVQFEPFLKANGQELSSSELSDAVKVIASRVLARSISSPGTMSLSITEFPQDILLELAKRLDVADLLSLLSFERTFWLEALMRIRDVEMQPLPLSTADSVDMLSLSELQNVVRRADRLMKNFKSEKPRPFHIGNFSVESSVSIFFIPGANLIVAYTNKGNCALYGNHGGSTDRGVDQVGPASGKARYHYYLSSRLIVYLHAFKPI
ncbi:hypothetical protein B0H13DRAFT_2280273 [Mycena leptocephala]|nr:hypothetical protein B0H13DRAFT_2280273 [Mycena leptocephala]